jgi:hypothetical protein
MAPDLHEVLEAAGAELATLGRIVEGLQDTLAPGQAGAADLQALDSLTQHLFALSGVLGGLGPGWDGQVAAVLDTVPLGCLQRRLRGQPAPAPDVSGDIDLFGDG